MATVTFLSSPALIRGGTAYSKGRVQVHQITVKDGKSKDALIGEFTHRQYENALSDALKSVLCAGDVGVVRMLALNKSGELAIKEVCSYRGTPEKPVRSVTYRNFRKVGKASKSASKPAKASGALAKKSPGQKRYQAYAAAARGVGATATQISQGWAADKESVTTLTLAKTLGAKVKTTAKKRVAKKTTVKKRAANKTGKGLSEANRKKGQAALKVYQAFMKAAKERMSHTEANLAWKALKLADKAPKTQKSAKEAGGKVSKPRGAAPARKRAAAKVGKSPFKAIK